MIYELTILVLFNSLFIQGLYRSAMFEWKSNFVYKPTKKNMSIKNIDKEFNMLLWFIRYYSIKYFGDKWSKPVITCPTCMASIHSSYFYFGFIFITSSITNVHLMLYVPYVFAVAGMNTLITSIIDK